MALFAGTFENKVDSKWRVSVPAPFRAELAGQTGGGVYLYPSLTDEHAIEACPPEWMEEMKAHLKRLPPFSPARRKITHAIFGPARLVKLDDDGRLVLPKDLAEKAGINGKATFVGLADTFQIWSPDKASVAETDAIDHLMENGFGAFGDEGAI